MSLNNQNKLFIATFFENKNENLCSLIDKLNSNTDKRFKIIPIEKMHITWKFIGYIDLHKNEKVFEIAQEYFHIIKNLHLDFDKLEVWSNLKEPRLICLTARNFDEKFKEYFNKLKDHFHKNLKIRKGKGVLIPHITIARIKSTANIQILNGLDFEPIRLGIKHTRVMQSISNSKGVEYKILCDVQ